MAGWQCKAPGGGSGQARSRRRAAPPSCARRDPRGPRTARTPRRRSRSGRSPRRGPGGRTGPGRGSTCRTGCGSGRSGRPTARRSPLLLVLLVLLLLAVVLATAAASEPAQPGEVDLGSGPGGLLVRGGDQAQAVDPGRGRRRLGVLWGGPRRLAARGAAGVPPPAPVPGEAAPIAPHLQGHA